MAGSPRPSPIRYHRSRFLGRRVRDSGLGRRAAFPGQERSEFSDGRHQRCREHHGAVLVDAEFDQGPQIAQLERQRGGPSWCLEASPEVAAATIYPQQPSFCALFSRSASAWRAIALLMSVG